MELPVMPSLRLGTILRQRRRNLHLPQHAIAARYGLTFALVAAVENGRRRYIERSELPKLASLLGMSETEFWQVLPEQAESRYVRLW